MSNSHKQLSKSLGPITLWGLGVGYVISGMYFGWNLGLEKGGTLGLGIATILAVIMYVSFVMSYTELTCAMPSAGGAFSYSRRALGHRWGLIAGLSQMLEFVFAPPAIAAAIGAYLHAFLPMFSVIQLAVAAYVIFTGINILGVKIAARFELVITVIAVIELLIFAGLTFPSFNWNEFSRNPLPQGAWGIFSALPFALWFFLGIEGIANVAEETENPRRNMALGFSSAMATLVFLCVIVFISATGVNGWEAIVFDPQNGGALSDSPLPLALGHVVGQASPFFHLLIGIGVFGLVASFHGLLLAAGRATWMMGEGGYLPSPLRKIHPKTHTPVNALLFNMMVGILALLTGRTGDIIILSCFGALGLYILSTVSLLALRWREPKMERPFQVPFFPIVPAISLILSSGFLLCMVASYPFLFSVFVLILGLCALPRLLFVGSSPVNSRS